MKRLNLFYEEPDPDRWFPGDRYPRRLVRLLVRGQTRVGGQQRVFLNLCAGLDRLGVPYRVNDYQYARRHPAELACIVGKAHVLDRFAWRNPILFGAAVFSHPLQGLHLFSAHPTIQRVLLPGEWMRQMFEPYYHDKAVVWPVGIDTAGWAPEPAVEKKYDFLVYDKIRWQHDRYTESLLQPIRDQLVGRGLTSTEIRYGFYEEEDFRQALRECRAMIFLCEHETQGIAYQQALSAGVPILAWDRGGYWQDPAFYPDQVKFGPVSSVPYWDPRCGLKFRDHPEFSGKLAEFLALLQAGAFQPRDFITENLTLEICARKYLDIVEQVAAR